MPALTLTENEKQLFKQALTQLEIFSDKTLIQIKFDEGLKDLKTATVNALKEKLNTLWPSSWGFYVLESNFKNREFYVDENKNIKNRSTSLNTNVTNQIDGLKLENFVWGKEATIPQKQIEEYFSKFTSLFQELGAITEKEKSEIDQKFKAKIGSHFDTQSVSKQHKQLFSPLDSVSNKEQIEQGVSVSIQLQSH